MIKREGDPQVSVKNYYDITPHLIFSISPLLQNVDIFFFFIVKIL